MMGATLTEGREKSNCLRILVACVFFISAAWDSCCAQLPHEPLPKPINPFKIPDDGRFLNKIMAEKAKRDEQRKSEFWSNIMDSIYYPFMLMLIVLGICVAFFINMAGTLIFGAALSPLAARFARRAPPFAKANPEPSFLAIEPGLARFFRELFGTLRILRKKAKPTVVRIQEEDRLHFRLDPDQAFIEASARFALAAMMTAAALVVYYMCLEMESWIRIVIGVFFAALVISSLLWGISVIRKAKWRTVLIRSGDRNIGNFSAVDQLVRATRFFLVSFPEAHAPKTFSKELWQSAISEAHPRQENPIGQTGRFEV